MVVSYIPTLMIQNSSIELLENSALSNDGVKDNKVDKFINWIIKKLDLIVITVKNDEVGSLDSDIANKIDKISAKFKNIRNC